MLRVSNETSVSLYKLTCFVICRDLSCHGYSHSNFELGFNIHPTPHNNKWSSTDERYVDILADIDISKS